MQVRPRAGTACADTYVVVLSVGMVTGGEPGGAKTLTCLTQSPARLGTVRGNERREK